VLARGTRIERDDLLLDEDGDEPDAGARAESLHAFLDAAAADRIRAVLSETSGARSKAADRLGVDRTTLYRLMRKYEIE
jgi:transcriptional regulator of acetoin/glycerol metabolism